MVKKTYVTLASIVVFIILIITFSCVSDKNKTKKQLSFFIGRNITLVSSKVDKISVFIQERTSTVRKKYSQIAQKLEEIPKLDEEVNNNTIMHIFKDSFSLVTYISQQEKLIEEKRKTLYNTIAILKNGAENHISSEKTFWTKGICNTAIDLYNENFNQQVGKIESNIQAFDNCSRQSISDMADLYSSYMAKTKQELSAYIEKKTLPVSKEVDRILSMAQEQTTQLQDNYSQWQTKIAEAPEPEEKGKNLSVENLLGKMKPSLAFHSYIEQQKKKNHRVQQDLDEFIIKTKEEAKTFISSISNLVIQDECGKSVISLNGRTGQLADKAYHRLSDSDKMLNEYTETLKGDTLLCMVPLTDKLTHNFDHSSLVKLKQSLSRLENNDLLKIVIKEVTSRIDFLSRLKNRKLNPEVLTLNHYKLLRAIENSPHRSYAQYAGKVLNSTLKIVSVKVKDEKEGVSSYGIRYNDKCSFNCEIVLKNRAPFPVDAAVLLKGRLVVDASGGQPTGLAKKSYGMIDKMTSGILGRDFNILDLSAEILGVFVGADEDHQKAYLIEGIPAKSLNTTRITLWSFQVSRDSPVKFHGQLKNRNCKIVTWAPSNLPEKNGSVMK